MRDMSSLISASVLCDVGATHGREGTDKKHYPTSQDLLLFGLFPHLGQTQLLAKQRLICPGHPQLLTASAPGLYQQSTPAFAVVYSLSH